jgi:hypothetical protein
MMKQRYVVILAVIITIGLLTQVPFGLMKQQERQDPFTSILNMLQTIDSKLDTIIELLTPDEPEGSAPEVQSVEVLGDQVVDGLVYLYITVHDEDVGQALDISTKFIQLPAFSSASLTPSIGPTPAFIPDRPGDYGLRVTVTDETGQYDNYELTITIPEPSTP